jgi:cob(I)alamin adenosyltransferase
MTHSRQETPVVLSRIYTRVGDDGTTALGDLSRAGKTDPRIAAYGDVDEANCAVGAAVTMGGLPGDVASLLIRVQNELFDVGADLCKPLPVPDAAGQAQDSSLRIDEDYIARLERECDRFNEGLPVMRSFILPGGTPGAALLHVARTAVRRAERSAWAAVSFHGPAVSPVPARYLNRLSDLLFILARRANLAEGDLQWVPGGDRE